MSFIARMKSYCFPGLALALVLVLCAVAFSEEETAQQLHQRGVAFFQENDFKAAQLALTDLISRFPDSPYAADAVFKIGESYYRRGNYKTAGGYFCLYLERYSLGGNIRDAKYRLKQCEEKVGEKIAAIQPKMEMPKGPLRAVRVKRFYQISLPSVDRSIAALKKKGVNTLIVPAFKLTHHDPHRFMDRTAPPGAYYDNSAVPVCTNLLPELVAITHKYGIRLFVEFPVRSMPGVPKDAGWDPLKETSEIGYKNDLFAPDGARKFNETVKSLARISIDGILIVDLAILPTEGFSEWAMAAYEQVLGKRPDMTVLFNNSKDKKTNGNNASLSEDFAKIAEIRGKQTSIIAGNIAKDALSVNPNLEVWVEVPSASLRDPASGLLRHGLEVEAFVNTPFNGVYFDLAMPDIFSPGPLTSTGVSDSIEWFCKGAFALFDDMTKMTLGLTIEDKLTKKTVPEWQIKAAIQAARRCGIENFAASPLKYGFDFSKVFRTPFNDLIEQ